MLNNKWIVIIGIVLLVVALCIIAIIFRGSKIKVGKVQSISVIAIDEDLMLDIIDPNDVRTISKILSKNAYNDSPSCPFGYVEIIIKQNDESITVQPATDGCHIFMINSKYFSIPDNEWESLMELLGKYGVDRSLFETGKGI